MSVCCNKALQIAFIVLLCYCRWVRKLENETETVWNFPGNFFNHFTDAAMRETKTLEYARRLVLLLLLLFLFFYFY